MKLRLTQSSLSAVKRPISRGIVVKRLLPTCTATRQPQRVGRRRLTLNRVSCVMNNAPAAIVAKEL